MPLERDEHQPVTLTPQSFNERTGAAGPQSLKVGWTRRNAAGRILAGFSYRINPQGLSKGFTARNQLWATKGSFYVDQFGAGASPISLRQLVASGRDTGDGTFFTQRDDVLRFLKEIWLPATTSRNQQVYFHDNHLQRGHEELVYFPSEGLNIQRSVDLHNVWLVEVQMVGLEQHPLSDVEVTTTTAATARTRYTVRAGDSLHGIARRLAGQNPTGARVAAVTAAILDLNPQIKRRREHRRDGRTVVYKPMRVYPGETLLLPAGR